MVIAKLSVISMMSMAAELQRANTMACAAMAFLFSPNGHDYDEISIGRFISCAFMRAMLDRQTEQIADDVQKQSPCGFFSVVCD